MSDGVSSAGRSGPLAPVSPASLPRPQGDAPAARGSLGHPELRSLGASRGLPDREYTVGAAVASYAHTRDLATLSVASRALREGTGPALHQLRSLVGLAGEVAGSREPLAMAARVLDQAANLPPVQRFTPLRALAAQVPHLPSAVADQVAARVTAAGAGLGPEPQAALQAALRGPDRGLHRGFAQTGFF